MGNMAPVQVEKVKSDPVNSKGSSVENVRLPIEKVIIRIRSVYKREDGSKCMINSKDQPNGSNIYTLAHPTKLRSSRPVLR